MKKNESWRRYYFSTLLHIPATLLASFLKPLYLIVKRKKKKKGREEGEEKKSREEQIQLNSSSHY